jgi:phosphinothricin acetyltransferase
MPAAFTIRPVASTDMPAIAAIYGHYVLTHPATFETEPPDAAEMAARMDKIATAGLPYWVAEQDQRVVGYCYVTPYRPRAAYRRTVENSVYVAPDTVAAGIGTTLLQKVMDECARQGYREIIAVIGDSANEPSLRLHRKAGFVHIGTLRNVGHKFDRWLDTVIMQKTLPQSGSE